MDDLLTCGAGARSSPSGDSFATLAAENQLNKSLVLLADSRLQLTHDQLSIDASIHSTTNLHTVRLLAVF